MSHYEAPPPSSGLLLHRGPDARTRIKVQLEGDSDWLSRRQIADLYQMSVKAFSEHLEANYDEGELEPERIVLKFRIVQFEGQYEVRRLVDHYAPAAISAVGYRVRSTQGSQFLRWAGARSARTHRAPRAGK